ncbi:Metal-dependent protein hydrolase, partial [Dillenia turbinata]
MLDAVLDVGGVYDPSRDRYDHHQKGFDEAFGHGFVTKLSSAGLIYKELTLEETHPDVHRLYIAIYKSFMEAIDAIDNGINQFDTDQPPRDDDADPSGEIMVLKRLRPWKLHLFELEEELKINPSIKYVLYQDDRSKHWRVQGVAVSPDRFEKQEASSISMAGLRDDELSKESGIPGCVFVHMSGFIGGNQTYDGALAMARAGLNAIVKFKTTQVGSTHRDMPY